MERDAGHWQARLPAGLLDHVAWPVRVEAFHDDTLPASKWRGYDALGLLCWYRHVFSRWSADWDDAGEPGELVEVHEMEAWRTLLGTWVRRVQRSRGAGSPDGMVSDTSFEIVTSREIPRL